jgi:large subunit ribosomal protein L18
MKDIRPRITISSTAGFFYAQLVDEAGKTLLGKRYKYDKSGKPAELCYKYGEDFGKLTLGKKIVKIRYDRNGNLYHGRVKAFADGLRNAKLEF